MTDASYKRKGQALVALCVAGLVALAGCGPKNYKQDADEPARIEMTEPTRGDAHLLISTAPILDAWGEIRGSVHTVRDITERKRAERRLQERMRHEESLALCSRSLLEGGDRRGHQSDQRNGASIGRPPGPADLRRAHGRVPADRSLRQAKRQAGVHPGCQLLYHARPQQ